MRTAGVLSYEELGARVMALPVALREQAFGDLEALYGESAGAAEARREAEHRRGFYGDPWRYFRDIIGWTLIPQQEEWLEVMEREAWVALESGTNLGKSAVIYGYGLYWLDVRAAMPDEAAGLRERGSKLMIVGPGHPAVFECYVKLLKVAARVEARGFALPGRRSEDSVLWRVRPGWGVEAFSPAERVGRAVSHSVSGRHEKEQLVLVDEAQGIGDQTLSAVEGMQSGRGNKIVLAYNPTESYGAVFERSRKGVYVVRRMSAMDHPNVRERREVVEGAVSHEAIDKRVRKDCRDLGPYPATRPDPQRGDLLYALPPTETSERGGRSDGVPGHPDGEVRVYRPRALFESQVLGRYPLNLEVGLFNPGAWDAGVERWKTGRDPLALPDAVGVDAAREGEDDCAFCPRWGEDGEALLRAYDALAKEAGEHQPRKLADLQAKRRARVGEIRVAPKGRGPEVATYIASVFPRSPWNVDEGGVGTSVYDHAKDVLRISGVEGVSFAAKAPPRLPEEQHCENVRAALYVRAAMLVDRGLVDPPDDPILREEILAHRLVHGEITVEERDEATGRTVKRRAQSVRVLEKDEIKKELRRSPDRADAFVLALWRVIPKAIASVRMGARPW